MGAAVEFGPDWHILLPRPGHWRDLVNGLTDRRLEAYSPMETVWRSGARYRSSFRRQLIPGYVFARLGEALDVIHQLPSEARFLSVNGVVRLAPASFVAELKTAEADGLFDKTLKRGQQLRAGDRVVVRGGLWREYVGEISRINRAGRARVVLNALGPVQIDVAQLERVA